LAQAGLGVGASAVMLWGELVEPSLLGGLAVVAWSGLPTEEMVLQPKADVVVLDQGGALLPADGMAAVEEVWARGTLALPAAAAEGAAAVILAAAAADLATVAVAAGVEVVISAGVAGWLWVLLLPFLEPGQPREALRWQGILDQLGLAQELGICRGRREIMGWQEFVLTAFHAPPITSRFLPYRLTQRAHFV
jgi:hypothetical protein